MSIRKAGGQMNFVMKKYYLPLDGNRYSFIVIGD